MNMAALYLGYIVIGLVSFALIGLSLLTLYVTCLSLYRVIKYKQTSRLIKKYETKNMYEACKIAVDFLLSKGINPYNKIEEVLELIEKYKERYNIKEE